MTKARKPLTFALAITTAIDLIGWDVAARVAGRAQRSVRHWADPDRGVMPNLAQALAIDRAYMAAGGDAPPLLGSYVRQLDIELSNVAGCRIAAAADIAAVARESGDALAAAIQAIQPDATPAMIYRAIAEVEEAQPLLARLMGRLRAILPGNGAVQRSTGEV